MEHKLGEKNVEQKNCAHNLRVTVISLTIFMKGYHGKLRKWDSLSHFRLVLAIENEIGRSLS